MHRQIRLVCLDVDGTLLDSELQLRRNVKEALCRIAAAGVAVAIVTGRNLDSTLTVAQELGIELAIITCSGAHIRLADGRTWETRLQASEAADIVRWGLAAGSGLFVDRPERSWALGNEEWLRRFAGVSTSVHTADVDVALATPPLKISLINERPALEGLRAQIAQRYPELQLAAPFFNVLDATPQLATKGLALQMLVEMMAVPLEQVAAIGDSENDLSIFRESGLSIAMANAPEDVRSAADWVAPSNDEEGVAWAVERIMAGD